MDVILALMLLISPAGETLSIPTPSADSILHCSGAIPGKLSAGEGRFVLAVAQDDFNRVKDCEIHLLNEAMKGTVK